MCPSEEEIARIKWRNKVSNFIHGALDFGGFFFEGFDLVNAFIYAAEGNNPMAALSLVCMIPGFGTLFGIPAKIVARIGTNVGEAFLKAGREYFPEILEGGSRLFNRTQTQINNAGVWLNQKINRLMGKSSDEIVGEAYLKSDTTSSTVWDYSKQFDGELSNFNSGYQINTTTDTDLYLVQFHSSAELGKGRSLKYWTTFDEANNISTIDDYMDKMALLSDWGARDTVSIARVPAGTNVRYAIGTARAQTSVIESRPGGGIQVLLERFDESWIIDTRSLK